MDMVVGGCYKVKHEEELREREVIALEVHNMLLLPDLGKSYKYEEDAEVSAFGKRILDWYASGLISKRIVEALGRKGCL